MRPKSIDDMKPYRLASHQVWKSSNMRDVIKIDWNESDNAVFPNLASHLKELLENTPINWYPPAYNAELMESLEDYTGLGRDYISTFAGSDPALDLITRAHCDSKGHITIVSPTYDNFRIYAQTVTEFVDRLYPHNIFDADYELHEKISSKTSLVYLCNPNNPTGWLYEPEYIESLLKRFPQTIFIIDEAYYEFVSKTCAMLVTRFNNLYVTRTFSKAFGLASLRIGYVISHESNISYINKIRNHKSVTLLAQEAALYALKHRNLLEEHISEVRICEQKLTRKLDELNIEYVQTHANFLCLTVQDPGHLIRSFEQNNIYLRSLDHLTGCENMVRMTIGTNSSIKRILEAFDEYGHHNKF